MPSAAAWLRIGCLFLLLPRGAALAATPRFHTACVVDYRKPVPPEWLKQAGIQYVYIYIGIPITRVDGKPSIKPKSKRLFDACLELHADTGIKVLMVSNYYSRSPKRTWSVDSCGRAIRMGCFSKNEFHDWMRQAISDMAQVFSPYRAFGGFCFDDAPGNRVDCCYCDDCRAAFKARYGTDPPQFAPHEAPARVDPSHPVLLWDAYHRAMLDRYNRTQSECVRAISKDLLTATITADSYYCGRHLSMDVGYEDTAVTAGARLQRIDRSQVRWWHLFQSFGFPRLPEAGEQGYQRWAAGCHITTPSPKIIVHREGPMFERFGRSMFLSPAEIQRLMRTTIAEGAPGIAFWASGRVLPYYPDAFAAMGEVMADVRKIEPVIARRRPFAARVGLVYSTATEVFEQPWKANTLERWQHLHAFEATAYALLRSSVQHQIVFDVDLTQERLDDFDVLVMPGVRFLTKPVAGALEQGMAQGKLTVLADMRALPLKGATVVDYDPQSWYRRQLKGYRQPRYLDEVRERAQRLLVPEIRAKAQAPVAVTFGKAFGRLFVDADGSLVLFIVNWDLDAPSKASINLPAHSRARDLLTGETLSHGPTCDVAVPPAGWRVLGIERRQGAK